MVHILKYLKYNDGHIIAMNRLSLLSISLHVINIGVRG